MLPAPWDPLAAGPAMQMQLQAMAAPVPTVVLRAAPIQGQPQAMPGVPPPGDARARSSTAPAGAGASSRARIGASHARAAPAGGGATPGESRESYSEFGLAHTARCSHVVRARTGYVLALAASIRDSTTPAALLLPAYMIAHHCGAPSLSPMVAVRFQFLSSGTS